MEDEARHRLTVALAGDVMLGRTVDQITRTQPPDWAWEDIGEELAAADLALVNLECQIAAGGSPWTETHRVFHFRAGPHAVGILRAGGIDCVNLANNHALDFGRDALVETLERLEAADIAHVGAGRDDREAAAPVIIERQGVRIGILGACDDPVEYEAGPGRPGTHRIDIDASGRDRLVALLRELESEVDVRILTLHWGPNMRLVPPTEFLAFARHLADEGLDVFHGHSAHVFQGVEWRDDRLILYDSGDFLDDYAVDPRLRNDWGLLFRVRVAAGAERREVERLEVDPVFLEHCRTRRARGEEIAQIRTRLAELSAPFGTRVMGDEPPWRILPAAPEAR